MSAAKQSLSSTRAPQRRPPSAEVSKATPRSLEDRRARWLRPAACVASGLLMFPAAPWFDLWPLAWIALVPTLWAIRDVTPRRALWLGWLTGLVANAGGFYWINGVLVRFGHMPMAAALPLFVLLVGYQGFCYGLWAWLVRRLSTRAPLALVAPMTMAALELVYWMMFPWYYALTQAWVTPIIQVAELGGPIVVTFLLLLVNAAVYEALLARPRRWKPLAVAAVVVAAALAFGSLRLAQVRAARAAAPKLKVGVVQANFGILEGSRQSLSSRELRVHRELSLDLERRGAQLIVWPESAYPYAYRRDQAFDWKDGRSASSGLRTPLIIGTLTYGTGRREPFNSALFIEVGGRITGRFDKNYLLLFGEYVPFYDSVRWIEKVLPEVSNMARGHEVTVFDLGPYRIAPMICYEDIIPSFGRRLAALRPHLFVNITNDAWFGRTSEPWQHLGLAVFRSVEHRLDLVRAVNTGVSAFVDATGRVYQKGPSVDPVEEPEAVPTTLLDEVALMEPRGLYGRLGDTFSYLNMAGTLLLLGLSLARRKRA